MVGLDRIDPFGHYDVENCRLTLIGCNNTRREAKSDKSLFEWAQSIVVRPWDLDPTIELARSDWVAKENGTGAKAPFQR